MKSIRNWSDLEPYDVLPLTGEACGLTIASFFDIAASGKAVIEKCLGVRIDFAEAWNRGAADDPHVGSIMLAPELLQPIGVFALLESGCSQVWLVDTLLIGIQSETDERPATLRRIHEVKRTFGYRGTAGDRNIDVMSGRVQ